MQVEVITGHVSSRGSMMLDAMLASAWGEGVRTTPSHTYKGASEWLLVWSLGHPYRKDAFNRHKAAGGRVITMDLGYWRRYLEPKTGALMRLSIDAPHPQDLLWSVTDPSRFQMYEIPITDDYDPDGPVVIVGMGTKGAAVVDYRFGAFEERALAMVRERWPERQVIYRPKVKYPRPVHQMPGADKTVEGGDLADVIRGASLVICQHSNSAVDAIAQGIPVLVEDGAAVALVGSGIDREPVVFSAEQRRAFFQAIAWWQWTPTEAKAGQVWRFIRDVEDAQPVKVVGGLGSKSDARPSVPSVAVVEEQDASAL